MGRAGGWGATTLLETDKIRQLIDMMVKNDLVEISLRDGDVEVCLRRPNPQFGQTVQLSGQPMMTVGTMSPPPGAPSVEPEGPPDEDVDLLQIASPMVGTFYAASSPDSPPFVSVGSSVGPDSVVCIVEAMKVFNEIKAEVTGTIEKILVKNEQAIEYGQPMFLVRPN